ncbi:MAG: hypothetical protein JNL64_07530 [Blastocatellia bacterium]|nr:hypothetical protein [Blastocatellia bacterium]
MKNSIKLLTVTFAIVLGFTISSNAQNCVAKDVKLTNGAATVSGKTGGCTIYVFSVDGGQRTRIDLRSSDNKAQFDVQDGTEDETGSTFYENQTKLDKIFRFDEFTIEVRGTAGATFTLSVKVGN